MEYSNLSLGFLLTICMLVSVGCATTGQGGVSSDGTPSATNSNSVNVVNNSSDSLTDYLRRIVGVQVQGQGPNARVTVRQKSSFNSNTTPLFVINGIRAGKNFASVYNLVNPSDVVEIKVLKGPETSMYGMDGANGVILISTGGN